MTEPGFRRVVVLLNPAGASGAAARRWARVRSQAESVFPGLELIESRSPGDLRTAAHRLALGPVPALLLAAGGDGTSHDVINGVIDAGPDGSATIGWLPIGSGNDLARSVGVPLDAAAALRWYRKPGEGRIDAGRVSYRGSDGAIGRRAFGNSFTVGLSVDVLELVRHGRRFGALSYFAATVRALSRHRPFAARVTFDGTRRGLAAARLVAVTNGASFGAGMRVTPDARIDDGKLDLLTIAGVSQLGAFGVFPRVYWGGHLTHPAIRLDRTERLTLEADGMAAFETDGELVAGRGPYEIEILPGALRILRGSE